MIDVNVLQDRGAMLIPLETGEILFQEGDTCKYYFQVASGQIRWVNFNEKGGEFLQNLVEKGESVGELPLFDGLEYAATAIANMPTTVIRLPKEEFHQLLKEDPQIHFAFSALLAKRLRFKFFMLKKMARHNPEDIVKDLLDYLHRTTSFICSTCNQLQLTRKQIGEMTGLRVETVIRVVQQLKTKGVLRIVNRKVYYGTPIECKHKQCVKPGNQKLRYSVV